MLTIGFRRRVSFGHTHSGALSISIARHNAWRFYIFFGVVVLAVFHFALGFLSRPLFLQPLSSGDLSLLPLFAFILVWFLVGVRISLWRAFGVEVLSIEHGKLLWTRTALFWVRSRAFQPQEVSSVKAITPWYGLSNRVEITASGRRHRIGDELLHDETIELASHLRRAVNLRD